MKDDEMAIGDATIKKRGGRLCQKHCCKSNAVKPPLLLPNKTSHDYFIKGIYKKPL